MHAVKEWKMSESFYWGLKPRPTSNDPTALAAEIEDFIRRMRNVTFVELQHWLGPQYRGTGRLVDTRDRNLVFWLDLAEPVVDALNLLIHEKRVEVKPTNPMVYLFDGGGIRLPIAKRPPRAGYRNPRWLPVVLNAPPVNRTRR
jgi:hypothetical protein